MPVVEHLCCFALKQFGGEGLEAIGKLLTDRYSDRGKLLLGALDRANRRAWRSLQIALTGESFWGRITDRADDRGLRQQMRLFLDKMPLPEMTDKHPYYKQCLQDLKDALKKGTLLGEVVPEQLHLLPERHVRCNPALAQYVVDARFPPVHCEGFFAKEMLDPEFVAGEEARVTRGWQRLQDLPTLGIPIIEYPLPEVRERLRIEAEGAS